MSAPLTIHCPECESILIVDPDTGAVLRHEPAASKRKVGSFEEAAQEVAKRKERAEGLFAATVEREKNKKEILEKTFQEALEKARKDPSAKPRGIFDDD
jgi:DNA-directed RNA polymerase subunit M/transcription elongation factor TFIIS